MTAQPHSLSARSDWRIWAAVAIGGFGGTEARYLLGVLFPESAGIFPFTTLAINIGGSFLLGWLAARWSANSHMPRWVQAGLGPGLLGSFTTFSAVSLVSVTEHALLAQYLALSLVLGLASAAAGTALGQRRAA